MDDHLIKLTVRKLRKEPNQERVDVLAGGAKPETTGQEVSSPASNLF